MIKIGCLFQVKAPGKQMKFQFIAEHKDIFSVEAMCRLFYVSRSCFYAFIKRPECDKARENKKLLALIKQSVVNRRLYMPIQEVLKKQVVDKADIETLNQQLHESSSRVVFAPSQVNNNPVAHIAANIAFPLDRKSEIQRGLCYAFAAVNSLGRSFANCFRSGDSAYSRLCHPGQGKDNKV